ncbi:MAG: Gfo/Idh/MocA family protein [Anaerolineales bacterium]
MPDKLKVGLIGLGYIGKVHATAYRNIPLCYSKPQCTAELSSVLRSQLESEQALMDEIGFDLRTTDPEEFFAQAHDIVDICTPNALHREQTLAALERGSHIYCEKPLAMNLEEARGMQRAAEAAGVHTHVAFVLRYLPAIRQMKALLQAGALGEVLNFRAHMFHSSYLDPDRPMSWRLREAESGGGAFADLGAHLIDLTHYLLGEVAQVSAQMRTFIQDRPTTRGSSTKEKVDVDDWTHCRLILKSGVPGHIEATRMAAGAAEETGFEIFGRRGSLMFHISHPYAVRYHDLRAGRWNEGAIDAPTPAGERPAAALWPNAKYSQGLMSDAHLASIYDFMLNIQEGQRSAIDFGAGTAVQEVLEAAYRSAREGSRPIELPL